MAMLATILLLKVRIGVLGRILSTVDHGSMVFRTVRGSIRITYKAAQEYRAVYLDSLCGEIDPMILPKDIYSRTWGGPVESSAVSVLIYMHIP